MRSNKILPWRVNFGIGYQRTGKIAVGAQVSFYAPVRYFETFSAKHPDLTVERDNRFVANVAVGFEAYFRDTWILRFGAFTDFSAAKDPIPNVRHTEQISLYGGTLAIGKLGDENETVFGVTAAGGPARTIGYDLKTSSYEPFLSKGYQYRVFLVYCGSFSI